MFTVTDAILGAAVLKQVSNTSHRSGIQVRASRLSGGAVPSKLFGVKKEDVTTLTSYDIEGMCDFNSGNFLSEGLNVAAGTVTVPYKNRANGGKFEGALSHVQLTGANAYVIPTSIEASDDGSSARGTVEVHWRSTDGHAVAVTSSDGNSLASEAHNLEFGLGTVSLNSTAIDSVTNIRINPGFSLVKRTLKGGDKPAKISLQTVDPTVDLTLHTIDDVATVIDQLSAGLLTFFLRARADGGAFELDATLAHLKFTFAAGISYAEQIETPETETGSVTIRVYGKALAVTKDQAIT